MIIAFIIALFSIIFAVQNSFVVNVTFLLWSFQLSMALLLVITFGIGVVLTLMLLAPRLVKGLMSTQKYKEDASPSKIVL
jgi:lipopolysaccharide assembly protein A